MLGQDAAQADAEGISDLSAVRLRSFGDYELLEEIARGGMGVVYKAYQISLNRVVAVKMILAGELASPADVQRFRQEAEAAANLQHPNIVAIHEIGQHEGQHYFSMDYVEGKNLTEVMAEGRMPRAGAPSPPMEERVGERRLLARTTTKPTAAGRISSEGWFRQAAGYMKTIAEAIHYAHEYGTLHRDLKPSNIIIDRNDQPRITDFGLAKRIKTDSDLTISGQIIGTPNFMPPEQASGKRREIGPHSDVYSLGAILYFLLTGRAPFHGETTHETLHRVLNSEPPPPRRINPEIPRDLEVICLKCLEKGAGRRYASAQALADDLARYLRGEPIEARPVGRTGRLWRTAARHRLVASLLALLVLSATVIAILSVHYHHSPQGPLSNAEQPAPAAMPARCAHGISGVIDGKIYVTSATDGNAETYPRSLYVYDPKLNSWKRLAGSRVAHNRPAGAVLGGKLYVAGGSDGTNGLCNTLEVYDPASNRWTTRKPMPTARVSCVGVALGDKFCVMGGHDGTKPIGTVESYDVLTDTWSSQPSMILARSACGAAVIKDTVYVVGGVTNQNGGATGTVEIWQPGGKWSLLPTAHGGMIVPVCDAFTAELNGNIFVFGGASDDAHVDLGEILVKNVGGWIWESQMHMPEPRYGGCGAVVLEGKIWVFGGWTSPPRDPYPQADVFIFDPARPYWSRSAQ